MSYHRQVQGPIPGGDGGDAGHPEPIGGRGGGAPPHQVRSGAAASSRRVRALLRCTPWGPRARIGRATRSFPTGGPSSSSAAAILGAPDGDEECFPLDDESRVPAGLEVGDIVSVRVVGGTVEEVGAAGGP